MGSHWKLNVGAVKQGSNSWAFRGIKYCGKIIKTPLFSPCYSVITQYYQ